MSRISADVDRAGVCAPPRAAMQRRLIARIANTRRVIPMRNMRLRVGVTAEDADNIAGLTYNSPRRVEGQNYLNRAGGPSAAFRTSVCKPGRVARLPPWVEGTFTSWRPTDRLDLAVGSRLSIEESMPARMRTGLSSMVVVAVVALDCGQDRSVTARNMSAGPLETLAAPTITGSPVSDESARTFGAVGGATEGARLKTTASAAAARQPTQAAQMPSTTNQEIGAGSMLVRVGQASLQVDSLEIGIQRVRDVARRTNAVIANTSMAGGREQTRAASLELRVPSDRVDERVNRLWPN